MFVTYSGDNHNVIKIKECHKILETSKHENAGKYRWGSGNGGSEKLIPVGKRIPANFISVISEGFCTHEN